MNPVSFLKSRPRLNLLAVFLWMAVIFLGSATPQEDIPSAVSPVAKLLHLVEYATLGFLVFPYVSAHRSPLLLAVAVATAYAVTDELHQLFVPGRHGSPYDVLIDSFGSSMGAYLARRWRP